MIHSTEEHTEAVGMRQAVAEDLASADPDSDRGRQLRDLLAAMDAALAAWDVPFGAGWAAGKEKAFFEVLTLLESPHAVGCGCEPCKLIRDVLSHFSRDRADVVGAS